MNATTQDPHIRRALDRIRRDGVLLSPEIILEAVREPRWTEIRALHDWRRHVPPTLREQWEAIPMLTRLCVFETAELMVVDEEASADESMVTGPRAPTDQESFE